MPSQQTLRQFWVNTSITVKYGIGIGVLLALILIIAVVSYISLRYVQKAHEFIGTSSEIQRLVFEMDRELEKARNFQQDFFVNYPEMGLRKAHEVYAQPSIRRTATVVSSSDKLRRMIATKEVGKALEQTNIDLNLYLSSAKRFADTSIEAYELAAVLADPNEGLEAQVDQYLLALKHEIQPSQNLLLLFSEMKRLSDLHRHKRERFLMQSAFNVAFHLRNRIDSSNEMEPASKDRAYSLLVQIREVANRILEVDVALSAKFQDFELQKKAADRVSDNLIAFAKNEVIKSEKIISDTNKFAVITLITTTLVGFVLSMAIAYILNANITLRILRLTESAAKLKEGQLDIAAEADSQDELGHLARTFNYMAKTLKKLVEDLEEAVATRTQELLETNQELQLEISDRKVAERRFRMAAEAMSDLIYEWNPTDKSLLWFGDIGRALGYEDPKEFPETLEGWLAKLHPDDVDRMKKAVENHMKSSEVINYEYRIRHKDGSWRCWFDYAVAILDKDGHPSKWVGICRDITEIKEAETEKQKLEEQLRQSHKMEAIGTLAGGIAHDFNNILSAVMGYSELVEQEIPPSSPAKNYIHQVLQASKRAKELVQHIVTVSRKESVGLVPVKVHRIGMEVLKLLKATIPTTIEIQDNIPPDCGAILADPSQIHQVLMNLCTNAAQAMEEEGGILKLAIEQVVLNEHDINQIPDGHHLLPGSYVKIQVRDTGPGIDQAIISKIFDPYFTTKETGKGSGMGLAVANGIVRSCHGAFDIETTLGKGTCFSVFLPQIDHNVPDKNSLAPMDAFKTKGSESILLVDDEPSLIEMNGERLKRLGYNVTACTDSTEALEKFNATPENFDLIITDQTMPRVTGEQLAKKILARRSEMPIIICTGYSSVINKDKARALGIREFVMKPIQYETFAETVRKVLDEKRDFNN